MFPEACLHYSGGYPPIATEMSTFNVELHRPHRADARRNFDALLAAARDAFSEQGSEASLEDIARRAGVGIGTLYRNFPTRQDLLNAVYVGEVEQLRDAAHEAAQLQPWPAWEAWLERFATYVATKVVDAAGAQQGLRDVPRLPRRDRRGVTSRCSPAPSRPARSAATSASTTRCGCSPGSSPRPTATTSSATACCRSRSTASAALVSARSRAASRALRRSPARAAAARVRAGRPAWRWPPRRTPARAARSASLASAAARASISSMLRGRGLGLVCSGMPSPKRSARSESACVNSDGITKTLFASPLPSSGSICRYW